MRTTGTIPYNEIKAQLYNKKCITNMCYHLAITLLEETDF